MAFISVKWQTQRLQLEELIAPGRKSRKGPTQQEIDAHLMEVMYRPHKESVQPRLEELALEHRNKYDIKDIEDSSDTRHTMEIEDSVPKLFIPTDMEDLEGLIQSEQSYKSHLAYKDQISDLYGRFSALLVEQGKTSILNTLFCDMFIQD